METWHDLGNATATSGMMQPLKLVTRRNTEIGTESPFSLLKFICVEVDIAQFSTMSPYESTKDSAARNAEETKNVGNQKAGEAQQATKVRISPALASIY